MNYGDATSLHDPPVPPHPSLAVRTEQNPPTPPGSAQRAPRSTSLSDALSVCREKLREQLAGDFSPESLREPIRAFAALARREEMPPERVLALIKDMVRGVSRLESKTPGERADITTQFVQMAIQAYYDLSDE